MSLRFLFRLKEFTLVENINNVTCFASGLDASL